MVDTERTLNDLLTTLFQDGQAAAAITPQDVRDLVVSVAHDYGSMHVSTLAATVIAAIDTWTKIAGTTTIGADLRNVTMPANNRLRNDADNTRIFRVSASIEYIMATTANASIGFGFAKNGTIEATTEIRDKHLVAADHRLVHLSALISLATTDFVEVFVINRTDGDDLTVNRMLVDVVGLAT